jgi:hypothetical protein
MNKLILKDWDVVNSYVFGNTLIYLLEYRSITQTRKEKLEKINGY